MSALAGAAVALPLERTGHALTAPTNHMAASALPPLFTVPFAPPSVAPMWRSDATTDYYKISMEPFVAEVLPGFQTVMWAYRSLLPSGPQVPGVPGPTIKATRGRQTVVRFVNNLPKTHPVLKYTPWTSVHLHGSPSLPQYDGYASDISNPGWYKDYVYPNSEPGRTLWYHDHGIGHTAENVSMGLEAQYHVIDPAEASLHLPTGEFDVPLIVMDTMFNADGSLLFNSGDNGVFGDVILVNGRPWPKMQVKRRKYLFRMLNGSPARSYKWSLDSGDPFTVIATDGGLMPFPQQVLSFRQGVGERYEVVIDFAKYPAGRRIVLRNSSPKNNHNFANTNQIMAFDVVADDFDPSNNSVPDALDPTNETMLLKESDAVVQRTQALVRHHGEWTIDGKTWDDVIASNFTFVAASPVHNTVELWTVKNDSGGWFHPAHIHLIDFQILDRNGKPAMPHERGPKDVVYVGEGESVRLLIKFDNGLGKYMIHCHNLTHEDHDMMVQYEVVDPSGRTPGQSPFSAPSLPLPESTRL